SDDGVRVSTRLLGSRRMTIVAWYGLVQDSPTRWTGQVGPYRTRPRTPESSWPAQVGAAAASTSAARASRAPRIMQDIRHIGTVCCSPALVTPATSDISAPEQLSVYNVVHRKQKRSTHTITTLQILI